MDVDDDRLNGNEITSLKSFKVPKRNLTDQCSYNKVSLDSTEYKDNIFPKIRAGFKNPNSVSLMKINKAFSIINTEGERNFNKKKSVYKREYSQQAAYEYYGFMYLSNISEFETIANTGKVKIGNLKESYLGKPDMGLSLSQYSDIYHPGDNKTFPRNGILLIVKYMRGRVCYIVEDTNPLEPQPNYDCHITKTAKSEYFPSLNRAFHSTQVFIFEYSEDLDIIHEPTQILTIGAVEFQWCGQPPYKLIHVPLSTENNKDLLNQKNNSERKIKLSARPTATTSSKVRQSFNDCTATITTNLQMTIAGNKLNSETVVFDVPVSLVTYNTFWLIYGPMCTPSWTITDLIEWSAFEQCLLNYHLDLASLASAAVADNSLSDVANNTENVGFTLSDVLNKKVTLSRNIENRITCNPELATKNPNKHLPLDSYYINYFRMVSNDPSKDRAKMARLIEYFLDTKTVGRINIEDMSDTLIFIFPDSMLSQNFAIPSVRTMDVNYLHVLLLKDKPIEYEMNNIDQDLESRLIKHISDMSLTQEVGLDESMISFKVLNQSASNQNHIQKLKLRQICGIATNQTLCYTPIDFHMKTNAPIIETLISPSNSDIISPKYNTMESNETYDKPYDPSENPLGLSDTHLSKANLVRSNSNAIKVEDPIPKKKFKKEEKDKINSKLLEIFAKIEKSSSSEKVTESNTNLNKSNDNNTDIYIDVNSRKSADPKTIDLTLDRTKFQQHSRNGISIYNPTGSQENLTTTTPSEIIKPALLQHRESSIGPLYAQPIASNNYYQATYSDRYNDLRYSSPINNTQIFNTPSYEHNRMLDFDNRTNDYDIRRSYNEPYNQPPQNIPIYNHNSMFSDKDMRGGGLLPSPVSLPQNISPSFNQSLLIRPNLQPQGTAPFQNKRGRRNMRYNGYHKHR